MEIPAVLTFQRFEKKYLLTERQSERMTELLRPHMTADRFCQSTVCNLYYDTDRYDLIRASLDGPAYREKLRVRCYGVPEGPDATCFVEIKKKLHGEVFKRRAAMTVSEAADYLAGRRRPGCPDRELGELDWFLRRYGYPKPKLFLAYDRQALAGRADPALRVTFDRDIRWRTDRLDLCTGDGGETVLPPGSILMEIKIPAAAPIWLAQLLSELEIRPVSYSKYGTIYRENLVRRLPENGVALHV